MSSAAFESHIPPADGDTVGQVLSTTALKIEKQQISWKNVAVHMCPSIISWSDRANK